MSEARNLNLARADGRWPLWPRLRVRPLVLALAAVQLAACARIDTSIPRPMQLPSAPSASADGSAPGSSRSELQVSKLPSPPEAKVSNAARAREAREAATVASVAANAGDVAAINLQQVPLPTFIQVVYAEILKRNLNVDPGVLARKELVTFRTGATQSAEQLENAIKLLLKSYGIAVIDVGGLLRVLPDSAPLGNLPELRRGEASPDTPLPLRPVFQLVELQVVRQTDVAGWLKTLFGDRIKIQEDVGRNALLLSGTPDNMQAALEALRILDQPLMSGRKSIALTPAYWSADDLAKRLNEVLTAQGYAVAPLGQLGQQGGIRYPVVLLPVAGVNSVYVFAASDEVLKHVTEWARTLDKPNEKGIGKNFFTYQVKHKDASILAKTLEQLLTGGRSTAIGATPAAGAAAAAAGGSNNRLTSVVVDQSTNMLIFQANPDEYSQITALLQTLDRPAKGALIEVTVAELTVTDNNQFGVEWLLSRDIGGGSTSTFGLKSTVDGSPFNFKVLNAAGGVKLALNALASTNRATILSSPRIQARNGEQATIQVGNEVPIITSSISTPTTGTAPNQVSTLQTIQYRTTGVILKVKPVIHSGDQIDLDVQQEVSSADVTNTGVNNTPTFSTRKLETKLTLKNGSTVLMGGLISNNSTRGNGGLPMLKDIPFFGGLFGSQTIKGGRSELVILITPYILNDNTDAEAMTDAFRKMLGPWAETPKAQSSELSELLAKPVAPAVPPASAASAAQPGK